MKLYKRIFAALLALMLAMGVAYAESALNYVQNQGYKLEKAGKSKKTLIADYDESSGGCVVTFSNKTNKYRVKLDAGRKIEARQLYLDILALDEWDTAAYSVDGVAQMVFNRPDITAKRTSASLSDYVADIASSFGTDRAQATEKPKAAAQSGGRDYILNTNTKKFHYPGCYSEKKIKPENRQEYTGTRDEIMAMGYDPCGNCHP